MNSLLLIFIRRSAVFSSEQCQRLCIAALSRSPKHCPRAEKRRESAKAWHMDLRCFVSMKSLYNFVSIQGGCGAHGALGLVEKPRAGQKDRSV